MTFCLLFIIRLSGFRIPNYSNSGIVLTGKENTIKEIQTVNTETINIESLPVEEESCITPEKMNAADADIGPADLAKNVLKKDEHEKEVNAEGGDTSSSERQVNTTYNKSFKELHWQFLSA